MRAVLLLKRGIVKGEECGGGATAKCTKETGYPTSAAATVCGTAEQMVQCTLPIDAILPLCF
jgi:hypothetical protein